MTRRLVVLLLGICARFVAGFLGSPQMNFVDTKLEPVDGGPALVFDEGRKLLEERRAEVLAQWLGARDGG